MFRNILINALVNLGDVVLTTSALALIKKNFPETRITMLVKPVIKDAVIDNPVGAAAFWTGELASCLPVSITFIQWLSMSSFFITARKMFT